MDPAFIPCPTIVLCFANTVRVNVSPLSANVEIQGGENNETARYYNNNIISIEYTLSKYELSRDIW